MAYKKKARRSTRAPVKSRKVAKYTRRPQARRAMGDGMNLVVSSYVEIAAQQNGDASGQGGVMGYSLKVDPSNMEVRTASQTPSASAALAVGRITPATGLAVADGKVDIDRFNRFKPLYRQMRVNSCTLKVTTDRLCGLDNPLLMSMDRDESTPIVDVGQAYAQAHKSVIMTESNRTAYYKWTPSTAEEREFHMISDGVSNCATFIKVLQELEPNNTAQTICKHRVEIQMSVSLKDSKTDLAPGGHLN